MASVIARDFKPDTHEEELFITQSAFRAVMDAMARPGQLRKLSAMYHPQGQRASTQGQFGTLFENRYLETLVCMLLDSSCTIVTGSDASTAAVSARSYAQPSEPDKARFAIITKDVPAKQGAELLAMLSGGSDLAPELGATAIIECQALAGESPLAPPAPPAPVAPPMQVAPATQPAPAAAGCLFRVTGPGVKTEHSFAASSEFWCAARNGRKDEFPCGIDLILVDTSGNVVALPRTALVTVGNTGTERG